MKYPTQEQFDQVLSLGRNFCTAHNKLDHSVRSGEEYVKLALLITDESVILQIKLVGWNTPKVFSPNGMFSVLAKQFTNFEDLTKDLQDSIQKIRKLYFENKMKEINTEKEKAAKRLANCEEAYASLISECPEFAQGE